jgi:hypothetical protein
MSQRLTHDAKASTSCVALPAPDAAASQLEQVMRHPGVPHTLFDEAQAEQALCQEFHAHGAFLNAALTEALQFHGGRSFQLFKVSIFT